jgi:hypothetical protein
MPGTERRAGDPEPATRRGVQIDHCNRRTHTCNRRAHIGKFLENVGLAALRQ